VFLQIRRVSHCIYLAFLPMVKAPRFEQFDRKSRGCSGHKHDFVIRGSGVRIPHPAPMKSIACGVFVNPARLRFYPIATVGGTCPHRGIVKPFTICSTTCQPAGEIGARVEHLAPDLVVGDVTESPGASVDGYPASHLHSGGGRHASEWVAGINRNARPACVGTGGRHGSEYSPSAGGISRGYSKARAPG